MSEFGFEWGPMMVERWAHIEGRGRVVAITAPGRKLQVYVSEQGRSVRVFDVGGKEWIAPLKGARDD